MNSFGKKFCLTTFGESHGSAIGGVIDGCPSNFQIDFAQIQQALNRRKTGKQPFESARQEEEHIEWLSGIFEGKTLGTPIAFILKNKDTKPEDYDQLKDIYRPSHADFSYQQKYGIRDHRGGGRASARETAIRVVAGNLAQQLLHQKYGITIRSYVSQIGEIALNKSHQNLDLTSIDNFITRCPDAQKDLDIQNYLAKIKAEGDTIGGIIRTVARGVKAGLGQPIYDKLQARLAYAMLSINAVKGFSYGTGFESVHQKGSQQNDVFEEINGQIKTKTNHSGGIQGGISNGELIYFDTLFKPVSSIFQVQETLNKSGEKISFENKGRHDSCVVPRAVPIVEAMTALVLLDFCL